MNTITIHSTMKLEDYTNVDTPSSEAWNWAMENRNGDVHLFEEGCLIEHTKYDGKIKIALLGEVPAIYDHAKACAPNSEWIHPYEWLKNNHHHFNYIMSPFTFLKDLVGDRYIWSAVQVSHVKKDDYAIYEKERTLSIIASWKRWTTGHNLRHEIINKHKNEMDVYGSGYNTIIDNYDSRHMGKIIAIAPYCFTIIVPNTNIDDWYSDQITDAMVLGTIPVFCGTKNVSNYFNPNGIIQFGSLEELGEILPTLTKDLYNSKMDAVLDNFERAKHHESPADWLYYNKKDFLENISL